MMGSGKTAEEAAQRYDWDAKWFEHEYPQHLVEITKPFYFQKTEVTQGQWKKVMGDNPSEHKECGDDCPVENVSWEDTQEFIKKLNTMEGTDTYRLPSEAEWEYAARAGTTTLFSFGNNERVLGEFAWCDKYTGMELHPVASKKPNPWGIYDLYGSVWEWVEDDWHYNYEGAPTDERAWTDWPRGSQRVMRGGSYGNVVQLCRSAVRRHAHAGYNPMVQGFRLAKSVAP
jgi:formylglycine-generating enzyme required for sulfatase activity